VYRLDQIALHGRSIAVGSRKGDDNLKRVVSRAVVQQDLRRGKNDQRVTTADGVREPQNRRVEILFP
jgi:hypothetical protein